MRATWGRLARRESPVRQALPDQQARLVRRVMLGLLEPLVLLGLLEQLAHKETSVLPGPRARRAIPGQQGQLVRLGRRERREIRVTLALWEQRVLLEARDRRVRPVRRVRLALRELRAMWGRKDLLVPRVPLARRGLVLTGQRVRPVRRELLVRPVLPGRQVLVSLERPGRLARMGTWGRPGQRVLPGRPERPVVVGLVVLPVRPAWILARRFRPPRASPSP